MVVYSSRDLSRFLCGRMVHLLIEIMQNTIRNWVLLVLIFSIGTQVNAQNKNDLLSVPELQEDFQFFRASLEEAHPGLYWFTSKSEMDHLFDSTYASLGHEISRKDFWVILSRLATNVRCLHTYVYGYDLLEDDFMMPFEFKILGDQTFIFRDLDGGRDLEGAEVLSIDGRPAKEILDTFLSLMPQDGYATGFAKWLLNFQYTFYHRDVFGNQETITLQVKPKNQAPKTITVTGYNLQDWRTLWKKKYGNAMEDVIQLKLLPESNTAILKVTRLDNWKNDGKKYRFKKVLQQKMEEIVASGSENLILDIGDQGGGNEKYGMQ